jgi:hypothetical protein
MKKTTFVNLIAVNLIAAAATATFAAGGDASYRAECAAQISAAPDRPRITRSAQRGHNAPLFVRSATKWEGQSFAIRRLRLFAIASQPPT